MATAGAGSAGSAEAAAQAASGLPQALGAEDEAGAERSSEVGCREVGAGAATAGAAGLGAVVAATVVAGVVALVVAEVAEKVEETGAEATGAVDTAVGKRSSRRILSPSAAASSVGRSRTNLSRLESAGEKNNSVGCGRT